MSESLGLTSHESSCNRTGCGLLRAGVCINCAEKIAALILESGPGELAAEPCSGACREAIELYFSTPPGRWRAPRARRRHGRADRPAMAVDAGLRAPRGPHAAARLRADARGCNGGVREELASGWSDVLFMQQINRKANHGALKNPLFRCVIVSVPAFCHWSERTPLGPNCGANFQVGYIMLKILTALAASLAMLSAAAAADLPRKEPPPPAPAPVGKYPVGKAPIGKYPPPAPVVTKG